MLQDLFGLKDKVSLVTGAGRGIGREVAIAFAQAGSDVALVSRTKSELDEVAEEIRKLGRRAIVMQADMAAIDKLPGLVHNTVKELGGIDILVNNAGISRRDQLLDSTLDDFDYMVDVNVKSVHVLSQTAVPYMQERGAGKIINVTSMTAVIADVGSGIYGMTKAGVRQLSKGYAVELARQGHNIQVNCVGPGAHATSQWKAIMKVEPHHEVALQAKIPAGRIAEPEEIVGAFLFLASNASNYMTGQTLYMDGGWLSS